MTKEEVLAVLDSVSSPKKATEPNLRSIYKGFIDQSGLCVVTFKLCNGSPFIKAIDGDITSITGYTKEEMLGKPLMQFIQPAFESDLPKSIEMLEKGQIVPKFQTAIRKDGTMLNTFGFVKKDLDEYVEFIWSDTAMLRI
jgi:hypothetical protein